MPEPSVPAGAEPSAEAIEAAKEQIVTIVDNHLAFNVSAYGKAWTGEREDSSFVVANSANRALAAAYALDAPVIRAEGYAAGRVEALREVVAWLRKLAATADDDGPLGRHTSHAFKIAADAIEATFPTTGETR